MASKNAGRAKRGPAEEVAVLAEHCDIVILGRAARYGTASTARPRPQGRPGQQGRVGGVPHRGASARAAADAEVLRTVKHAADFGVDAGPDLDLTRSGAQQRIVDRLTKGSRPCCAAAT
jgi:hypothetical protein